MIQQNKMNSRNLRLKLPSSSRIVVFLTLFTVSAFYLLHRCHLTCPSSNLRTHEFPLSTDFPTTTLDHLLFSIASSSTSLPRRLPYLHLWHSKFTRSLLFLDSPFTSSIPTPTPTIVISGDTSRFPYTFPRGLRSAIRVARIVKEAVDRAEPDIRWFVFGDDDTVFVPENLVNVLNKYDHDKWYYVGSTSESLVQNVKMSFDMAYGGGGFAISASLGRALAGVLDSCLIRYSHLYGSDSRISSCVAELGVGLTKEPGFHQLDVRGDVFGLLTAHPLSPLLSLHHLDVVEPIFPRMNKTEAVQHLFKAIHVDPGRTLQQSVCYDHGSNITVSVAWGYAVQVFEGNQLLTDILMPQRTFKPWKRGIVNDASQYVIDTKEYPRDRCKRPTVFFLEDVASGTGTIWSKYTRYTSDSCPRADAIRSLKDINVSSKRLEQGVEQLIANRRQCCVIKWPFGKSMVVDIRHCGPEELIAMNV